MAEGPEYTRYGGSYIEGNMGEVVGSESTDATSADCAWAGPGSDPCAGCDVLDSVDGTEYGD